MQELNFSRKSWHAELAGKAFGSTFVPDDNFCTYFWQILWGFVMLLFFCVLCAAGMFQVLDTALWLWTLFYYGFYIEPIIGPYFLGGVGSAAIFITIIWLIRKKTVTLTPEQRESSFIISSYRTFKDKVCFKINWSGTDEAD